MSGGDLARLYAGNPEAFLDVVFHQLDERTGGEYDLETFATAAERIAVEEGVNLFRAINEHPEHVRKRAGEPITFDDALVEMIDRLADPVVDGLEEP